MSTQWINALAVEVSGEGEALLCIHGLGGSSNTWTPLLPALTAFKVIRLDLPGSGRSPLGTRPLSIDVYVHAVEQVLESLGVDKVHLVAHSMGTIVAAHFAARAPERVLSLALFGPLLAPPDAGRAGIHARAQLAQSGGVVALQEIADAIVKGATAQQTKDTQPAVLALVRECIMRQSAEGYSQSCSALGDAQPAAVARISAPALLVTGDQDGVAPPGAVEAYAAQLPAGRSVTLPACGHWAPFEQPQACISQLQNFYQSIA